MTDFDDEKQKQIRDAMRLRADLLRQAHTLEQQADQVMLSAITNARSGGYTDRLTWEQIGDILGVSYQRAQQKWGPRIPKNTTSIPTDNEVQSPTN
jgi:hypothetical protein